MDTSYRGEPQSPKRGSPESPQGKKSWLSFSPLAALKRKVQQGFAADEKEKLPFAAAEEENVQCLNDSLILTQRASPRSGEGDGESLSAVRSFLKQNKPQLRTAREDCWWSHVEICQDSLAYNDAKVILALQYGLKRTLAEPGLSVNDIEECLVTALYLYMIGSADLDFVFMHSLAMTALRGVSLRQRRLGYTVCGLCLAQSDDRRLLLVNSIQKDMKEDTPLGMAVALTAAAQTLDAELFANVITNIVPLMNSPQAIVKKKAIGAVHACLSKCGEELFTYINRSAEELFMMVVHAVSPNTMLPSLALCAALVDALPNPAPEDVLEKVLEVGEDMVQGIGLFQSFTAKPSVFVQVAYLRLLSALVNRAAAKVVVRHGNAMCTVIHHLLRRTKGFLQTKNLLSIEAIPHVSVVLQVCRTVATPALLPLVRREENAVLRETIGGVLDELLILDDPNNKYIALRCLAYLSLVDNQEGFDRQEHVIDAVRSSDPALLLAAVDVMCSVAREANVRAVLLKLLTLAKRMPSIKNFAVKLSLKASLVQRAHILSWDVARPGYPMMHLHTSLRLLTEYAFLPAQSTEQHTLRLFGWLHKELALQEGEAVRGHGDLELCGDDDSDAAAVDEAALRRISQLRAAICRTMTNILEMRREAVLSVVSRDDGLSTTVDTEPVSSRLAAWVIGEFGAWHGPSNLEDHVLRLSDAIASATFRSSPIATVGTILSLNKLLCIYGHLRITRQPNEVDGRDTALSTEALATARAALVAASASRDVTVAGAAGEALTMLDMVTGLLKQLVAVVQAEAGGAAPAEGAQTAVTIGGEILEELSLPHCTYIQQDVDVRLSCLDGFVAELSGELRSEGKTVRPYLSKEERHEREEAHDDASAASLTRDPSLQLRTTDDGEVALREPSRPGPWGAESYVGVLGESLNYDSPASSPRNGPSDPPEGGAGAEPGGNADGKGGKKKGRVKKTKKTHAWFEAALELAGGAEKAKAAVKNSDKLAVSRTVQVAAATAPGMPHRWGAASGGDDQIYRKLPPLQPAGPEGAAGEGRGTPTVSEAESPTALLVVKNNYWGAGDDVGEDSDSLEGHGFDGYGSRLASEGRESLLHRWQ